MIWMVTTGSGTGVVAAHVCINLTIYLKNYSVKHWLYNIHFNGKKRELLNPASLCFWSIVRSGVNIRFGIELECAYKT